MNLTRLLSLATLVLALAGCPESGSAPKAGDGGTAPVPSAAEGEHKAGDGHDHK